MYIYITSSSCSVVSDSLWPHGLPGSLSTGFSRQEYCSGLPVPSPGNLPDPGIKPGSPTLQADFFFHHLSHHKHIHIWVPQVALVVKNLPANAGELRDACSIPGLGRIPGRGQASHSSILAWKTPWTKEAGELQSIGLQRVGHNWSNLAHARIYVCECVCSVASAVLASLWSHGS